MVPVYDGFDKHHAQSYAVGLDLVAVLEALEALEQPAPGPPW